jgi:hypothetical protein
MAHVVRNEAWGVTDLDLVNGHVFVRQDWHYRWVSPPRLPPWTRDQRFHFHHALDHMIWARWSLRAHLQVSPDGKPSEAHQVGLELAARFGKQGLTLSFDIRSVTEAAHWQVEVNKTDPNAIPLPQSTTDFARRILKLHQVDIELVHASRKKFDPRRQPGFSVAAHEFGHAIGYANPRGHLDEYLPQSRYYDDVHSIMNIGRHIRARHLALIGETLTRMVPGCSFRPVVEHR